MQKKHLIFIGCLMLVFVAFHGISSYEFRRTVTDFAYTMTGKSDRIAKKKLSAPPSRPLPALIDVGAKGCTPCRMMEPTLKELEEDYTQSLRVEFIDLSKNPEAQEKYRVRVIPTQIFYDASGNVFARHVGYISKAQILEVFKKYDIEIKKD
jgi:thioredoxin 1